MERDKSREAEFHQLFESVQRITTSVASMHLPMQEPASSLQEPTSHGNGGQSRRGCGGSETFDLLHPCDPDLCLLKSFGRAWIVVFKGEVACVETLDGMRYLAVLLANPNEEYFQSDLVEKAGLSSLISSERQDRIAQTPSDQLESEDGVRRRDPLPLPMADRKAVAEVRADLKALEVEASSYNDNPRQNLETNETIKQLQAYLDEVQTGTGKIKTTGKTSVSASCRKRVGKAIGVAADALEEVGLPDLKVHIRQSIKPYAVPISYCPADTSTVWEVENFVKSLSKGKKLNAE